MAERPAVRAKPLTRQKLASFLGNNLELIKAFEAVIDDVSSTLPDAIKAGGTDAEEALAAAEAAAAAAASAAMAAAAASAAATAANNAAAAAQAEVDALEAIVEARKLPVGSVYVSVSPTDPASALGYGTWTQFGQGRVLIGVDTSDTDFDTVLETGGSKTSAIP